MPSDPTNCPADYTIVDVKKTGDAITTTHPFNMEVPLLAASTWHCKYGVTAAEVTGATAEADRGYYYLIAEGSGFDDNVIIIVQPRGQYLDFNFRSQTNNPAKMTKVFKSYYGRKYIIPAEYDIFIDFAPIKYKTTDQVPINPGQFSFLAKWIPAITDAYESDDTVEKVRRLPALAGDEVTPTPVADPTKDGGSFEQ